MKKYVILYADNSVLKAKVFIEIFEKSVFEVTWVRSKQEAIDFFRKNSFDLIISEVKLGESDDDGFQIAEKIRESDQQTPIVFLTHLDDEKTAVKALEIGGQDYIRKSIGKNELIARIKRIIRDHPVEKENPKKAILTSDTCIDLVNYDLISFGHATHLPIRELKLLLLLLKHKNEPQMREEVSDQIWPDNENKEEYMNKAICKFRKLLKPDKRIQLKSIRKATVTLFIEES